MPRKSAERQFKELFPKATIERQRTTGGQRYYLIRRERGAFMPCGDGKTKREAWENALERAQGV